MIIEGWCKMALRIAKEAGTMEPGERADIIAVRSKPL